MTAFLKSRLGIGCVVAFLLLMAFALQRVSARQAARAKANTIQISQAGSAPTAAEGTTGAPGSEPSRGPSAPSSAPKPVGWRGPVENAAYLDTYVGLAKAAREEQDSRGNPLTRRRTSRTVDAGPLPPAEEPAVTPAATRPSLRLSGRGDHTPSNARSPLAAVIEPPSPTTAPPPREPAAARKTPRRFNPYGRVIKCELVFTIDSSNEQTPLVGLVMEPVYNNGALVIPAGAELHGVARPDRVRDRLFSGTDWVLVFPREGDRPNGRQLNVRGVALQREDPQGAGLTWGLTDGSYGLEGTVIRSHDQADIKRFLATFLAAGAVTLQENESRGRGRASSVRNTPQNAALQGVAVNLERYADAISAEIEAHGVFIRVPAGHQFYFYPTQIIDAEAAAVSADVATVK